MRKLRAALIDSSLRISRNSVVARNGPCAARLHRNWLNIVNLHIKLDDSVNEVEVIDLYRANKWSSAKKPAHLMAALANSHCLVTARVENRLVGLGNAISDGFLVVYYPHMLVHPEFHRKGIGKEMMEAMQTKYSGFHQQILVADGEAIEFYRSLGFTPAGRTQSMWIYGESDH